MLSASYPKSVDTRLPPSLEPASLRRRKLYETLDILHMEKIKKIPLPPYCKVTKPTSKKLCIELYSNILTFETQEQFDSWLTLFPPVSQKILRDTVMRRHCFLIKYQDETDIPLAIPKRSYYNSWEYKLDTRLGLDFLYVYTLSNLLITSVETGLRDALKPWFVPPPEATADGCAADEPAGEAAANVYNNAMEVPAAAVLLYEALGGGEFGTESIRPLTKKQIAALRAKCGFKEFPKVTEYMCESLDIAARFILCMTRLRPKRPDDGQTAIKNSIKDFFVWNKSDTKTDDTYTLDTIKSSIFTEHLKTRSARYRYKQFDIPQSRKIFHKILIMIAQDGRWFSTEKLASYVLINEKKFRFTHEEIENNMYIKASSIMVDGITMNSGWGENGFTPVLNLHFDLLVKPLFKAYCSLFAAFGLLEAVWREPPAPVITQDKPRPFSPYDALDAVRITGFGRWCLGLTEQKPAVPREKYEAIADRELLLVTVRGTSLERSLYLDAVGIKLGEDRWRISPRSFIAGCGTKKEIEERVKKFKQLIDAQPAPHWDALFSRAVKCAGVFNSAGIPAAVYYMGDKRGLFEELLNDEALSVCAMRAEGGLLVVPEKLKKRFLEFLAEHGIAHF